MRRQLGFTLIEITIFIIVMGIVGLNLLLGMQQSLRTSAKIGVNTQAVLLAEQRMELILGLKAYVGGGLTGVNASGMISVADPCASGTLYITGTGYNALCAQGAYANGYTVSTVFTTPWNGNANLEQVVVTVTGPTSYQLTSVLGNN